MCGPWRPHRKREMQQLAIIEKLSEISSAIGCRCRRATPPLRREVERFLVASATEELSSSVTEISRQVPESARIASEPVNRARRTNDQVSELSKAAARIRDVVELINTIAGQTNLLVL